MAIANLFRKRTKNTRKIWGYTFELSEEHPSRQLTESLKTTYDNLGEDCLRILQCGDFLNPEAKLPPGPALPRNHTNALTDAKGPIKQPNRDLYALLQLHHAEDPTLTRLWAEVNHVPDWVDWDQISRGQDVFYRYGGAILTGLAYQSLLGGMAAGRIVETLARTGGFSTKVARRRLYETTQYILQCTRSLASVQPGGDGWAATIRVRLLHAAVRARILKLAGQRPEYYSVEECGIPISDLDSIATIGSFSASIIWIALPRQGIYLRSQEIADYIALWRYIAYVIGCPEEPYSSPDKARRWMEILLLREMQPTETSKILANNIIKSLEDRPPIYISANMLVASARWLNGGDLCDSLGLPRPSLYYTMLVIGQCMFFMVMTYGYRYIPSWDRGKIEFLRKAFWITIVESKSGLEGQPSFFEFRYVPEFATLTEMGDSSEAKLTERSGIELRNLKWFFMALCVFVVWLWVVLKIMKMLWRMIF